MLQPTTSLGGQLRMAPAGVTDGNHSSRIVMPQGNPTCLCGSEIWRASGKQDRKKIPFQLRVMMMEMVQ